MSKELHWFVGKKAADQLIKMVAGPDDKLETCLYLQTWRKHMITYEDIQTGVDRVYVLYHSSISKEEHYDVVDELSLSYDRAALHAIKVI
jgi:hypothetical protein